MMMMNN